MSFLEVLGVGLNAKTDVKLSKLGSDSELCKKGLWAPEAQSAVMRQYVLWLAG